MARSRWQTAAACVAVLGAAVVSASGARAEDPAPVIAPAPGGIRLNQIQVVGSHNSYHLMPSAPEVDLREQFIGQGAEGMEYVHQPLPFQFESQRVRQIELDVFLDPDGGRYADPLLRSAAGVGPYDSAMDEPGMKVLHVQDVDYASSCLSLKVCLSQVEQWSEANPTHAPIAILLELKDDPLDFGGLEFTEPLPWNAAAMDDLDDEIRSVVPRDGMLTPDDVRGDHDSLAEAVTTDGWPTLEASRGKLMFLMDNAGHYRDDYRAGHPALEGRVVFTNADPGDPDAAFLKRNDAFDPSIPDLVRQGYVVRTRADGDTVEARANDTSKRDAALASGAQWVSTDYPQPGMAVGFTSPYFVQIPGGTVARCNPVNAPVGCDPSGLDTVYTAADLPTTTTSVPPQTTTTAPAEPGSVPPATGAEPISGSATYTG